LPARVAILVAIFLIVCVVTAFVGFYHTQDRTSFDYWFNPMVNPGRVLAILVLMVAIPFVVYKVLKLWLEGEISRFPDIDYAWKVGVAALEQNGLDLTEIPIFLIIGSAGEHQEKALMQASGLSLRVQEVPQGQAELHWYANPDGIYLVCTNIGCLSKLAGIASEVAQAESSGAAPLAPSGSVSPGPAADSIRGTIVTGGAGAPDDSRAAPEPVPPVSAPAALPGAGNIRGTMIVGAGSDQSDVSGSGGAGAASERRVIHLESDEAAEQDRRLDYLCQLIRRARQPLCPINGILTLLPYGLIQRSMPEGIRVQRAVRRDLETLRRGLKLCCPVTAMVVGLEEVSGFRELVRRVGRERAAGQRFGKGFDISNPPLPERLAALSDHACGAFEDWVYALFREKDSLSKPGNTKLYALLCKVRRDVQNRLSNILSSGFACDPDQDMQPEPRLFGGCYFAAVGDSEDRQAFVKGVFDKLPEQQEELQWTPEALADDERFQYLAQLGLALDSLLLLTLLGMIAYKWFW